MVETSFLYIFIEKNVILYYFFNYYFAPRPIDCVTFGAVSSLVGVTMLATTVNSIAATLGKNKIQIYIFFKNAFYYNELFLGKKVVTPLLKIRI